MVNFIGCANTNIGFLNVEITSKTIAAYYAYEKLFEALKELGYDISKAEANFDSINEFDFIIIPQLWDGIEGKFYVELSQNLNLVTSKICHFIVNGRKNYTGRNQSSMANGSDFIWCSADFMEPFKQHSWYVPSGCWEEKYSEKNRRDEILAPMRRGNNDKVRAVSLLKFANTHPEHIIHLSSIKSEWSKVHLPKNVQLVRPVPLEAFKEYKFVLECASSWCQNIPGKHWSDRITFAVSNGAHLITDYEPSIQNWKSAIPHNKKEFHYNHNHISIDQEKWDWKKIIQNIAKETFGE